MDISLLLAGLVTGLVLGLTGAGGSLIAIPILVGGLHWAYTEAVPVARERLAALVPAPDSARMEKIS